MNKNLYIFDHPPCESTYTHLCGNVYVKYRESRFGRFPSVSDSMERVPLLAALFDFDWCHSVANIENMRGCTQVPFNFTIPTNKGMSHLNSQRITFEHHFDFPDGANMRKKHDWLLMKVNSPWQHKVTSWYEESFPL